METGSSSTGESCDSQHDKSANLANGLDMVVLLSSMLAKAESVQ